MGSKEDTIASVSTIPDDLPDIVDDFGKQSKEIPAQELELFNWNSLFVCHGSL